MSAKKDDGWLSDAAHDALQQQTQQHLASAQQSAAAAEAAHAKVEQLTTQNTAGSQS